jgi:hypothetical protein
MKFWLLFVLVLLLVLSSASAYSRVQGSTFSCSLKQNTTCEDICTGSPYPCRNLTCETYISNNRFHTTISGYISAFGDRFSSDFIAYASPLCEQDVTALSEKFSDQSFVERLRSREIRIFPASPTEGSFVLPCFSSEREQVGGFQIYERGKKNWYCVQTWKSQIILGSPPSYRYRFPLNLFMRL